MELLQFQQQDCPAMYRNQILTLMQQEWPHAFENQQICWPEVEATHPISLVLIEDHTVISHVGVPSTNIQHQGLSYKAFGLSEVMTHPSYRRQGLGMRLLREAMVLIRQHEPDISIFTCSPALQPFYMQGGWTPMMKTCLVGGTREKPFRSDALGIITMMQFFSEKAQASRHLFEETDVYIELGERKLW
ncbi:GNAT family N-acetyltransferase [Paenibacillus selenitireducens]|uniref:GNAT family N-acetyltransferase n=1 Tax=Paenibacillus selenitireducens TaxID=1324314 RepID=A0A1T2X2D2_9BACL|nr:GNAT family N-acetyltransferase [Paenibacillus selenitireducens]OPA73733.1 GNAT family N-acetyltransferase [Paenibacillus selenitireducens]